MKGKEGEKAAPKKHKYGKKALQAPWASRNCLTLIHGNLAIELDCIQILPFSTSVVLNPCQMPPIVAGSNFLTARILLP